MTDKSQSFIRSLCVGEIQEEIVFPYPQINAKEEEILNSVLDSIDSLLGPHAKDFQDWDRQGEMPPEFINKLREFGLFGLVIPEEYGGLGFGSAAYSRTLQQISKHDASVAVTVGAHNSIGMRGLLLFGTEEQKERYLPKLATGEMIAAFCLTEAGAGSDAASIKTTALRDGDDWILNGSKIWITNGGFADFFTVFAKTGQAEERANLAAFIVTRDMPGVSVGPHEDKMGIRASSTTSVYFDHVRVPGNNLLGSENGGFKVAMRILNAGRSGLGGGSVGGMKKLIEKATIQSNQRKQFGSPIGDFGSIKQKIGQMVVDCYATESVVHMVASLADQGYEDFSVEAAISKVFATEVLWRSADEALQIAGGSGYMREYPYEQIVRDCRINRIFEGTNEVLRLFIALTAMRDVGEQLKDISSSLKGVFNDPIKGFGVLSEYAMRRAGWVTGFGASRGALDHVDSRLSDYAKLYERMTRDLATAVDRILRKHGKNIINKQLATRRLADIMIDLFVLVCVLSRVDTSLKQKGVEKTAKDREILQAFAHQVEKRVKRNIDAVDDNEDESIKLLANEAMTIERFEWDILGTS